MIRELKLGSGPRVPSSTGWRSLLQEDNDMNDLRKDQKYFCYLVKPVKGQTSIEGQDGA